MDYTDRLRRLALNDAALAAGSGVSGRTTLLDPVLDARTLALVRIGALVAVGGASPSYEAQVEAAVSAGASAAEIVDVVFAVAAVAGLPRAVAAAPHVAVALGYDLEAALGEWPA
ncbi:carboxymuconolactone decarboxylase family protein [Mumia sp. DW29H23]|uniref:carboxymuconolactone decarboxylase family protein n=1 Tax=Mumia sp. DW29H23 TaxID=3421241 RepID=UPI003D684CDF